MTLSWLRPLSWPATGGRTLDAYRSDLRGFFQWAADSGLDVLSTTRPQIELTSGPWRNAAWRPRPSTGGCRPSAASTASPTSTGGSPPARPSTSGTPGSTRLTLAALIGRSSERSCSLLSASTTLTLRSLSSLGLNGLRVSEACFTDIENLGFERGHRTLRIIGKGDKPAVIPLVPRTARTIDLAIGKRTTGPILLRRDGERLDRRTAHRWVRSVANRAGLGLVHPHMLRAAFIMCVLDAGVPLREVQVAARHADPRTTTVYDHRRQNLDKHAAYVVVAFAAGG